ncbi:MAG: hypothetical protein R3B06_28485 [Kofleriaceae bacterium]
MEPPDQAEPDAGDPPAADRAEVPAAAAGPPRVAPRRRWLRNLALAVAGLGVGLGVAECAFRVRDRGGFPQLNVYVADPSLGVRLRPGATQRFAYPDNPVTSIRINRAGYRGADFPPPGPDDVLVVGDSQVFGLGVEEHETFAAALAERLGGGRHVLNGGVPTYGPAEYVAVARELMATRRPRTVVFTVNLVNDLFEAGRPNAARHVVRDGWAVRAELAHDVVGFPGRAWLARNSHLFYALRQALHRQRGNSEAASEGTWRDLGELGGATAARQAATAQARDRRSAEVRETEAAVLTAQQSIDDALLALAGADLTEVDRRALEAAGRDPGDTVEVFVPGAEESRPVVVTASHIRRGAALRRKLRARLAQLVAAARLPGAERERILASLAAQPELRARLDELTRAGVPRVLASPVAPMIRELKQACDEAGARLVVLILPIDVAVSPAEWRKYGAQPVDMTGTEALAEEIVALDDELGVATLDATAALRAAEPGAFLDHDIHLTPKGHAAVAEALAQTLAAPPPVPRRAAERAPLPLPVQWRDAPEIVVAGSTAARCETKLVRGWLRILCFPADAYQLDDVPRSITVTHDTSGTAMTLVMPRTAALTVAVAPGDALTAEFASLTTRRRLDLTWDPGATAPVARFTDLPVPAPPPVVDGLRGQPAFASELARDLCRCWQTTYHGDGYQDPDRPFCPGVYGQLDPGCAAYQGACAQLVACVLTDPAFPPRPSPPAP